jgi:ERCC4-type nuclease
MNLKRSAGIGAKTSKTQSQNSNESTPIIVTNKSLYPIDTIKIPDGFKLIVDPNEQQPLFSEKLTPGIPLAKHVLRTGDYSIDGFVERYTIERKKISDLYTLVVDKNHTIDKIDEMANHCFACLLIEASEDDIMHGSRYTRIKPACVYGFLMSLQTRFGIHVYISNNRDACRKYILTTATKFFRYNKFDKKSSLEKSKGMKRRRNKVKESLATGRIKKPRPRIITV